MSAADHELDYRHESFRDRCAREDREEHFQEKKDQLRRVVKKIEEREKTQFFHSSEVGTTHK
jgi:hypothetical protein